MLTHEEVSNSGIGVAIRGVALGCLARVWLAGGVAAAGESPRIETVRTPQLAQGGKRREVEKKLEEERRKKAEEERKRKEAETKRRQAEEERNRRAAEKRRKAEEARKRKEGEEARKRLAAEKRRKAEEARKRRAALRRKAENERKRREARQRVTDRADCESRSGRDMAIAACTRLIESGRLSTKTLAITYNSRGVVYYYIRQYDRAIANYTRAIELEPDYVVAYNNRGLTYEKKGRKELAIADYRKAVKLSPYISQPREGLKRLGAAP